MIKLRINKKTKKVTGWTLDRDMLPRGKDEEMVISTKLGLENLLDRPMIYDKEQDLLAPDHDYEPIPQISMIDEIKGIKSRLDELERLL